MHRKAGCLPRILGFMQAMEETGRKDIPGAGVFQDCDARRGKTPDVTILKDACAILVFGHNE